MAIVEIRPHHTEWGEVETAAKAAIPRATVLRVQECTHGLEPAEDKVLVLLNTQRTFGHFAILEWNRKVGALHTGHYFDSMSEAVADFDGRGGDLSI